MTLLIKSVMPDHGYHSTTPLSPNQALQIKFLMANIHRLNDNPAPNRYRPVSSSSPLPAFLSQHKIPFLYSPPNSTPPLQQSVPLTIKLTFCPSLTLFSLVNFLTIILVALFITEACLGLASSGGVLQIQAQVMQDLGANIPYLVFDGQVYRLVTAAFLHANLGHLLGNVVTLYIILTRLEPCYNPGYLVTLYLLAAVSGNVLSDLASSTPNQIAVGASTAIYGYIGTLIAYLIINWAALAVLGPMRSQLACVIGMLTFFSILLSFTSSSNTVDYMGHLGGFVGGLFGSMLLLPPINLAMPKTVKIVGAVVLSVYLLVVFLVFYLAKY